LKNPQILLQNYLRP